METHAFLMEMLYVERRRAQEEVWSIMSGAGEVFPATVICTSLISVNEASGVLAEPRLHCLQTADQ